MHTFSKQEYPVVHCSSLSSVQLTISLKSLTLGSIIHSLKWYIQPVSNQTSNHTLTGVPKISEFEHRKAGMSEQLTESQV